MIIGCSLKSRESLYAVAIDTGTNVGKMAGPILAAIFISMCRKGCKCRGRSGARNLNFDLLHFLPASDLEVQSSYSDRKFGELA